MTITEVKSKQDEKDFLLFPLSLYKNDPNWIRPLDKDIEAVFDPKQNKFFRHGQCARFLLKDEKGKVIGRVAAFINEKTSKREAQPTGGIGFFECINDLSAANKLFDHCKQWLSDRGILAMDGPINFGERDAWWGLMVSGFQPPIYKMNYNPPYYQQLFEAYGFQTYFEQWCYSLDPIARIDEKFYRRRDAVVADGNYRAEYIRKSQIQKYAEDFRTIYNKAWARHGGGKELDSKQVQLFFKKMKPVIDEKIVWFIYYKNEPVAMWINIPDINRLFKKFNGRLGIIQKLRFVWMIKQRSAGKFIGVVFGVVPEHQGKGVDAYMILEGSRELAEKKYYREYEMQWIGDFNPKMIRVAEDLGTQKTRVLKTYRYLFDRTKEFKRHPML